MCKGKDALIDWPSAIGMLDPNEARKSRESSSPLKLWSPASSLEGPSLLLANSSIWRSPCWRFSLTAIISFCTKHKISVIYKLCHQKVFVSGHMNYAFDGLKQKHIEFACTQALVICYACRSIKTFNNGTVFLHDEWKVECEKLTSNPGLAVAKVGLWSMAWSALIRTVNWWATNECEKQNMLVCSDKVGCRSVMYPYWLLLGFHCGTAFWPGDWWPVNNKRHIDMTTNTAPAHESSESYHRSRQSGTQKMICVFCFCSINDTKKEWNPSGSWCPICNMMWSYSSSLHIRTGPCV